IVFGSAYAVLAAWAPWLYALLVPAAAAVLYLFPAIREGLWLDLTVWYTDMRLGFFPGPQGFMAWVVLGLAVLGFGLLFVREPLKKGTAFWTFFGGTLAFGHMWLWGSDMAASQYALFLISVVPLWAAGGAVAREYRWYGAGRRVVEGTAWLGGFILALFLAVLAAWVIPVRQQPVEMWGVTAWARSTFPALEKMRGAGGYDEDQVPTGFTLTTAGFARRLTELGGPIRPDDGVAIIVTFPDTLPENPVYLRGTAMTNYNGRGWALETKSGDVGIDSPPTASELTMAIDLVGLNHTTLFYPRELAVLKGVEFNFGREGHIYAKEPLKGPYTLTAYLPGGRPVGFAAPQFDPGKYLALPKSLPARVGALAEELTKGKPTPYDEALAIEDYLRSFEYAYDVPATPPGRDFVDYFLYDLKKGYCAYSATAMTVMLRTQGIPARWVQGFVVAPGRAKVDVTWNYAHAWVEAYFPGYGWTTFDPTPRFSRIARAEAAPQGEFRTVPVVTAPVPSVDEPLTEAAATAAPHRPIPWAWIAAGAAALAWLATSFRRFFRERVDWEDERSGVLRSYRLLLAALRRMGFGPRAHQTPLEHAGAVAGAWPDVGDHVRRAATHATAARFAPPGAPAPEGARRAMGGALAAVWYGAQRRWGALRTAWIRFRFLWGKD
ncbi:MAG TPA: transglutaminase domain-containing protein, partial [Symbiobacteriaceae bacterium]|nr:transglutaminase domain-containing protein [Symbiobacteriaceae bacterium]